MWGWISRALGAVTGAIDDTVRRWVGDLISAVYGFMHTIFGNVGKAWSDMWRATNGLRSALTSLANEAFLTFYHLYKAVIPFIVAWAWRYIQIVWAYAKWAYGETVRAVDYLKHAISIGLDQLREWVVNNVWKPLSSSLNAAWHWITHEGATLWHYLTHIAELVDLLWDALLVKIEREAWTAGALLGKFFLSLILHNLKRIVLLAEDIIDAVL